MQNSNKTSNLFKLRNTNVTFMWVATAVFLIWLFFSFQASNVPFIILGAVVYGLCYIAHIVISVRYWRCPHCDHRFPVQWRPVVEAQMYCCPSCGKRLKW